jgi:hypothetical protein
MVRVPPMDEELRVSQSEVELFFLPWGWLLAG